MQKEHEHTLTVIRECLAKNMPNNGKAILFGSQARGTARDDSDWDILVILDKEELLPSDYDNVTYPLVMLGWELGKEINPVMYSAKEWQKYKNSLFYKNVEKDGIKLWGQHT
ncbi:nucleotidyltransferase domain-containing protein [Segatella copri]|uniref:nucleotidyltransferase domain-containing protein n=1 Tax=Segatella copri TaxID=165179 RepID=UPI001C44D3E7|nr:nucleotidyltransferase domain-containing protein [Segatella copri]MBW0048899.1 nucleotidyltransferase domain-containing protein [Segatella copri]